MPCEAPAVEQDRIEKGSNHYPANVLHRLGSMAPPTISIIGASRDLSQPMAAFLCSKATPGATILKAFDQAAAWRETGTCVVSGFHSPLEQQCLEVLLRGQQQIFLVLARGISPLRLPAPHRKALEDGRLTVLSPFPATERRATADLARQRNRFVAALATEVVFAYITPGGSLAALTDEVKAWDGRVRTLHS